MINHVCDLVHSVLPRAPATIILDHGGVQHIPASQLALPAGGIGVGPGVSAGPEPSVLLVIQGSQPQQPRGLAGALMHCNSEFEQLSFSLSAGRSCTRCASSCCWSLSDSTSLHYSGFTKTHDGARLRSRNSAGRSMHLSSHFPQHSSTVPCHRGMADQRADAPPSTVPPTSGSRRRAHEDHRILTRSLSLIVTRP